MEKLETEIGKILDRNLQTDKLGFAPVRIIREVSQEVKDIAIAFAEWKEKIPDEARFKSNEELFNDFIQTYYPPPHTRSINSLKREDENQRRITKRA